MYKGNDILDDNGNTELDWNNYNSYCIRAALCAGFYPDLLRVEHPDTKFVSMLGGTKKIDAEAKSIK